MKFIKHTPRRQQPASRVQDVSVSRRTLGVGCWLLNVGCSRPGRERGIALVITLIMLAITLVMAVAFLALAQRERQSVTGTTDLTVARQAADSGVAYAQAQINANILSGVRNGGSSNAYNLHLFVSTNYVNGVGFTPGSSNPTNVNYNFVYLTGNPVTGPNLLQNISNLWFLPRAPVYIPNGQPVASYDFRYYLDLNQNGRYDTNYYGPDIDNLGNPLPGAPSLHIGDPEWIGVLEHPDAPHGPNNHFISRYAFIAVPVGNTLDINYIHNQARNQTRTIASDYYMRNQGVGAWEINLAALLADLNTNVWGYAVGSGATLPPQAPSYYDYQEPNGLNRGVAFDDARALLAYRYNSTQLTPANSLFANPRVNRVFPFVPIDEYSDGQLQTTLDYNNWLPGPENPTVPWSGGDNTNHFFTPSEFFNLSSAANSFSARLKSTGTSNDTYNAYTFYRMLDALGTDSTPDEGKINLNFSNAVVSYVRINGTVVPSGVNIIPGAETNLVPWTPQNFFNAAADQMLRTYTASWFQSSPSNYMVAYYGAFPRGYLDSTGMGVTNFPNYGVTNQIPSFGITNIPVFVNSNFVYSPAVNRLLQLAANLYDASTNGPINGRFVNLPHVFRPIFEHDTVGNVFIVGYTNLYSAAGANTVTGPTDPQLAPPHPITDLPFFNLSFTPIYDGSGLVNVYGVPWIIGAKKGLPNFNQLSMVNQAQVTRKIEVTRTTTDPNTATYTTNEMYLIGVSNNVGVTWWNSYSNAYPRSLQVYASDVVGMILTNSFYTWSLKTNLTTGVFPGAAVTVNPWQGSLWNPTQVPNATPNANAFVTTSWGFTFQSQLDYDWFTGNFLNPPVWQTTSPQQLQELPQFGLLITNYLQAYILDGNYVVDYVQLRDPISTAGLNQALADPDYIQTGDIYYQWSTNYVASSVSTPYGVANQLYISGHPSVSDGGPTPSNLMPKGGSWATSATPMGQTTPPAEAAYFNGFFVPDFQYLGQTYVNNQTSMQAPYTPSRTVYSSFLLQANDPLVHYTSSDLGGQAGAVALWQNQKYYNAVWYQSDDPASSPLPTPPLTPIKGRYQPWGVMGGQMTALKPVADDNGYNLACRDSLAWGSDSWDFPTNLYPSVGWIGRVHRGTPWQTIYLKSTNIISDAYSGANGLYTWGQWTGDLLTNSGQYFDAYNSSPAQDRLLFDVFTARFNDNASRGTLPVNQTQISAWSAILSGLVAITNDLPFVQPGFAVTNTYQIVNPAGFINPALAYTNQPPVWQIVDGPLGINATRANTNIFPFQGFVHAGDVLATPALSTYSPFLNNGPLVGFGKQQWAYGINDEEYEWLPQQIMGLVRATQPRYVLYCFGQTLRPAPNGTVLSGPYFQMVTNYQVTAESGIRAVIRIDGANTSTPHAVIESYNPLPPN
jgi:hypothetical protein